MSKKHQVEFEYIMMDHNGNMLGQSGIKPVSFVEGRNQIFPMLEKKLRDVRVNQPVSIVLDAKDAFGEYDPNLLMEVARFKLAQDAREGDWITSRDGQCYKVLEIQKQTAVLDANHPLAGVDLTFDLIVRSRTPSTGTEIHFGKILNI